MHPLWAAVGCFGLYAVGYGVYARHLARRVFRLDAARPTPAHTLKDDIDYVPTNRWVLFGHHYASITGLAPMLGPAVAVIWGWVPAMLWVVLGAVFVGCVHDFSALVVSMRAKGQSIGKVAEGVIGPRAKGLFLALIFFGIALAMGVFVYVIAVLFQAGEDFDPAHLAAAKTSFPSAVLPSGGLMILAMIMGYLLYRRGLPLAPLAGVGFVLLLGMVWLGTRYPTLGMDRSAWPGQRGWTWILLGYGYLASVLPVWSLLQARDFLNSLLLYLGLVAAYAGFFVLGPSFAAPAVHLHPEGAPSLFPFVFIVIACGAASGFHSLVSSGTTAKQIDKETDARGIGYGGMIGESLLGLLAVLACTAGFETPGEWTQAYADWATIQAGLAAKLGSFIHGSSRFIGALGVGHDLAAAFIAVVVVSFALTTLDSATRLLRFNVSEIGASLRFGFLENRFVATAVATAAIAFFAFYKIPDAAKGTVRPAGLVLWTLFGTTNQLLAGLALLVATLYLRQRGRNPWLTGVPTVFMLVSTFTALVENLSSFARQGQYLLLAVGTALLVVALGIVVEGVRAFLRGTRYETEAVVFVTES
ncbi:MAG: carbon starvation protein A [Planctomycetota bacterium]|nr:MAG: carbon starvation protein A [Planctomycetota bacterium]